MDRKMALFNSIRVPIIASINQKSSGTDGHELPVGSFSPPTDASVPLQATGRRPTCLFLINGLGLGNSTRCFAVLERLIDAGCRIHVLTSGNGLAFFADKKGIQSVNSMESFFYSGSNGGISGWSTLRKLPSLLAVAKKKRAQLDQLLDQLKPDVAVIDSEYTVSPLRRRDIPVIGLNTSEMVVTEFLRQPHIAAGTRSQFWFIEFTDYLFHKHFCDLVLSPFPLRTPTRHRKFKRIGLITRSAIQAVAKRTSPGPFPSPRGVRRVVFMLSGSVHASNIQLAGHEVPFHIDVVGVSGQSFQNVTYHGRRMDNVELLSAADVLVINGGYSAVSEAFVLRKPTYVVPVPGHAEQFVNACLVRDLGLGFVSTESKVLADLLRMYERNEWVDLRQMPPSFETKGAFEAASAIMSLAAQRAASR